MKTASDRLYAYLLQKLEDEPIRARAALCEDLAEFMPNAALAKRQRAQAEALRQIDREAHVIRLSLQPDKLKTTKIPAPG